MKTTLTHLLVTLDLVPDVARLHSYVICQKSEQRRLLDRVINRMFDEAESRGIKPWPGIVLSTTLDDGWEIVEALLRRHFPDAMCKFDTVKNFHMTMWAMEADDPDEQELMALH